jgi:hypothetical protein
MSVPRLRVALVLGTALVALTGCGDRVQATPTSVDTSTITIEQDPHVTFEPASSSPEGILSAADAFDHMAPSGHMPDEEVATLGYLTYPPQGSDDATSFSVDHQLVWGFSLPNTCPPDGLGVGQDPSVSASDATTSPSPSACTSTEWNFADARSGDFVLSTWQVD